MTFPSPRALPRLSRGNELHQDAVAIRDPRSVQKKSSTENRGKTSQKKEFQPYCAGDSAGVSSVPAGESVVAAGASVAAGLVTSVVAGGGVVEVGLVAGATVSVFCSHAARSAAPARMQMYFFIVRERTLL